MSIYFIDIAKVLKSQLTIVSISLNIQWDVLYNRLYNQLYIFRLATNFINMLQSRQSHLIPALM